MTLAMARLSRTLAITPVISVILLMGTFFAESSMAMTVVSPVPGSVAFLAADGGLEIKYTMPKPATIKVDVFGFADPNGWPGVQMGSVGYNENGALEGSITLYDLRYTR